MTAKQNLRLNEAAKLEPGQEVIFQPLALTCCSPNSEMSRGLTPGTKYRLADVRRFGFKEESTLPLELSDSDMRSLKITEVYGRPLTNVCFLLEGISGFRCCDYFQRA